MGSAEDLRRLRDLAQSLEKSIDDIDQDIDRATARPEASGRLFTYVRERHNAQLGYMYELGKAERQIEDLENLIREQQEQPEERKMAQAWQEHGSGVPEDQLDWFKQSLNTEATHEQHQDEQERETIQDRERGASPDDRLDWLPRR